MEGPVQDPCRDRGNQLRIETSARNRQASGTAAGESMLCRSLQSDGLQHQEMGKGLPGLKVAVARLYGGNVRPSEAIRLDAGLVFRRNHVLRSFMVLTV